MDAGQLRQWLCAGAMMLAAVTIAARGAEAAPITHTLIDYQQFVGRTSFFSGRLLTADDFADEQKYGKQKQRFLPDVEQSLNELFAPAGVTRVTLVFDGDDVTDEARVPDNADPPHSADFILLDDMIGRWRGWLWLADYEGTFDLEGAVAIPAPSSAMLLLAGVAAFAGVGRRFRR